MGPTDVIRFNALPKQSRERLVAAARGKGEAAAIHRELHGSPREGVMWAAWGAGSLLILVWILVAGFGESVDGYTSLAFEIVFAVMGLAGVLGAVAVRRRRKGQPIPDGIYLFAVDVVVVRGGVMALYPMAKLVSVEASDRYVNGNYALTALRLRFNNGAGVTLSVRGHARAKELIDDLNHAQRINAAAVEAQDMGIFERKDPFYAARTSGQWEEYVLPHGGAPDCSDEPRVRPLPLPLRKHWWTAVILGAGLGAGLWFGRNLLSDERMYAQAKANPTVFGHQSYLREGGTRHAADIEAELKATLLPKRDLADAKAEESVTALREYRDKYPDGPFDAEAKQAIHELFEQARQDFRQQSGGLDPEVVASVEALLAALEARDSPRVPISFQRPDPTTLELVDEVVAELRPEEVEGLRLVPISPSFTDERCVQREAWIANNLEAGFRQIFPADILSLEVGERLLGETEVGALAVRQPTFVVAYAITASGSIYREVEDPLAEIPGQPAPAPSPTAKHGYVGIKVAFHVTLLLPAPEGGDRPKPLTFVLTVQPPPNFETPSAGGGISIDESDYLIYDVMARVAFEKLADQLEAALFGRGQVEGLEVVVGEPPELGFAELGEGEGEEPGEGAGEG